MFRRGTIAQTLAATIISFIFFAISFREQPFKKPVLNYVKIASEFHVFGILLICVVLQTNKSGFTNDGVTEEHYGYIQVALTLSMLPITMVAIVVAVKEFRETISDDASKGKNEDGEVPRAAKATKSNKGAAKGKGVSNPMYGDMDFIEDDDDNDGED